MVASVSTPRGWGEPARPPIPSAATGSGLPPVPDGDADGAASDGRPHPAMGLGELMERVIAAIRTAPRSTWAFGAIVVAVVGLLELLLTRLVPVDHLLDGVLDLDSWGAEATTEVSLLTAQAVGAALAAVVGAAATAVVVAFTARTLANVAAGERSDVAGTWRALRPRVGGLLLLVLLAGVVVTACLVLPTLALALLGDLVGGPALVATGAVVGLVAGLLAAVRFVPAVVLAIPEHAVAASSTPAGALRRTRALVAGERWRLVGFWLLAVIVLGIAGSAVSAPFSWLGAMVSPGSLTTWAVIGSIAASAVTAPLGALALTLVHAELAERRGAPASAG